jgi:Mg2+ and Co2+ transporter CorA
MMVTDTTGYRYSYPLAIGSMILIGVGMYRFFRKRGWFG